MDNVEKILSIINDVHMNDEEYKNYMKFDSDEKEIDISNVEFRISTAKEVRKQYDISNFMKSEGRNDEN